MRALSVIWFAGLDRSLQVDLSKLLALPAIEL
jgi:hypothetical protein